MKGSDKIVSFLYIERAIIIYISYAFCIGKTFYDNMKNTKEIIDYFNI